MSAIWNKFTVEDLRRIIAADLSSMRATNRKTHTSWLAVEAALVLTARLGQVTEDAMQAIRLHRFAD